MVSNQSRGRPLRVTPKSEESVTLSPAKLRTIRCLRQPTTTTMMTSSGASKGLRPKCWRWTGRTKNPAGFNQWASGPKSFAASSKKATKYRPPFSVKRSPSFWRVVTSSEWPEQVQARLPPSSSPCTRSWCIRPRRVSGWPRIREAPVHLSLHPQENLHFRYV